jgi:hypothetical protein
MICCGSGSNSGEVPVPVRIQTILSTVLRTKKKLPFQCQKQHYFSESWPLIFDFLTFSFWHFMLDPDPNPVPEPWCIPVPLRQKLSFLQFRFRFHNTGWGSALVLMRIRIQLFTFCYSDHFPCSWIRIPNTDPDPGEPSQCGSMLIQIRIRNTKLVTMGWYKSNIFLLGMLS